MHNRGVIAKTYAAGEVILEASFDGPAFSVSGTTVLASLGIEFATSLKQGQYTTLPQSGTMAIVFIKDQVGDIPYCGLKNQKSKSPPHSKFEIL